MVEMPHERENFVIMKKKPFFVAHIKLNDVLENFLVKKKYFFVDVYGFMFCSLTYVDFMMSLQSDQ